jgi:hypothetical protein
MMDKKVACGTILGFMIVIILFVVCVTIFSHATTTKPRENSLGVITYTINPYIYEAGSIIDYAIIGENEGLAIRVKPLATYMLFDETILFCGVPAEKLDGHENPMVLVYERQSHHRIDGLGCHELVGVRDIKGEKEAQ